MKTTLDTTNFINWANLETSTRRGKIGAMGDFCISSYRNTKTGKDGSPGTPGNYITLSRFLSEVYAEETKIRVGKINKKVVIQFNSESGINIAHRKKKTLSMML